MIYQRKMEHVPRLLIPFMLPKTQVGPRFRLRICVFKFPSALHWRLRTPSAKFFVLAALELYCSCALLPLCYLLQGSRHQACFFTSELQDVPNSTFFGVGNSPATSSSNRMLWLHTLLLATSTSQGRFILSETMPRYRAFGRKVGLEPTTLKDGEPSILPTELLASKNNYKTIQDIVVGGSSELQKTSTEMRLINNELDIFL